MTKKVRTEGEAGAAQDTQEGKALMTETEVTE
jgi:hypothetical protein